MSQELFIRVRKLRDATFEGAVSQEEISALQAELGVNLPDGYLRFMSENGGGEFGGLRIFSLRADSGFTSFWPRFGVAENYYPMVKERRLIPFGDNFGGDNYYFDFSDGLQGEPAVVQIYHDDPDQEIRRKAASFLDFIEKEVGEVEHEQETELPVSLKFELPGEMPESVFSHPDLARDGVQILSPNGPLSDFQRSLVEKLGSKNRPYLVVDIPQALKSTFTLRFLDETGKERRVSEIGQSSCTVYGEPQGAVCCTIAYTAERK